MSRLLFAAARGARIQNSYHNWKCGGSEWREANLNMLSGARIHPKDKHLAYGPISTALREKAKDTTPTGEFGHGTLPYMDVSPYFDPDEFWDWVKQPEPQRSLFLLILAEALADEGL